MVVKIFGVINMVLISFGLLAFAKVVEEETYYKKATPFAVTVSSNCSLPH